jgi:hypothetical protein
LVLCLWLKGLRQTRRFLHSRQRRVPFFRSHWSFLHYLHMGIWSRLLASKRHIDGHIFLDSFQLNFWFYGVWNQFNTFELWIVNFRIVYLDWCFHCRIDVPIRGILEILLSVVNHAYIRIWILQIGILLLLKRAIFLLKISWMLDSVVWRWVVGFI